MTAATLGVRRSGPAIAFFAYNRPHHLAKCLASMRMNPGFRETPLYFFLDGPRTVEDVPSVAEVGKIVRSVAGLFDARIVERGCNWGLSRNIIDGISQVLADHVSVIVVETTWSFPRDSSGIWIMPSSAIAPFRWSLA
jgi:hypothetical protein